MKISVKNPSPKMDSVIVNGTGAHHLLPALKY